MTTRMKTFVLGLVLALSVCLVAAASHDTNAYFTDAQSGTLTGTLASGCNPYRLCLGTAKAKHWDGSACGSYRYQLISQCDKTGALSLDFGDALCGQQTAWPDVFRLVSLVSDPRKVSFTTSGPIAAFVTAVRLDCGASSTLAGHATAKVYVAVSVPSCARPGEYYGHACHSRGGQSQGHPGTHGHVRSLQPANSQGGSARAAAVAAAVGDIHGHPTAECHSAARHARTEPLREPVYSRTRPNGDAYTHPLTEPERSEQ